MKQINVNTNETKTIMSCVTEFNGYARKTVDGTLEMSRVVRDARNLDGKKGFEEFCEQIGFEKRSSTIKKLQCIGKKYEFLNEIKDSLPSNWTTLYQISRIENDQISDLIQTKVIHPNMTGKEILNFHTGVPNDHNESVGDLRKTDYWFRCSSESGSDKDLDFVRSVVETLKDTGLKLELSAFLKEELEVNEVV